MYQKYNPNPKNRSVIDCTVRALSKVLNQSWSETYINLCIYGLLLANMPEGNEVWGRYLKDNGFKRKLVPDSCPDCYTVADFVNDHPKGTYVLALSGHVVAAIDGIYYDSWDSGSEVLIFFWEVDKE